MVQAPSTKQFVPEGEVQGKHFALSTMTLPFFFQSPFVAQRFFPKVFDKSIIFLIIKSA
jgi:hypothetical protein